MRIESIDLSTWASALPPDGFDVFHLPEALRVVDEHVDAELRLFAGYKGDSVVGLFPLFVEERAFVRLLFSPPPGLAIPRLGPLVMPNSPKQRKREAVNREFIELVLEEVAADSRRSLLRVACPTGFGDPRPFEWSGLRVGQAFTYVLDLEGTTADSVKRSFSKSLRRDLRTLDDANVTVGVEGPEMVDAIYRDVDARFEANGESFPLSPSYVADLVESLEDRSRIYVARDEAGEYLGGIIVLYCNDAASFWQGGVATSVDNASVNTALHWEIISDLLSDPPVDGVTKYDFVGANTPRLCRYKSKFGADLVGYNTIESNGVGMAVAKQMYEKVKW
jgi:hypothetical protein